MVKKKSPKTQRKKAYKLEPQTQVKKLKKMDVSLEASCVSESESEIPVVEKNKNSKKAKNKQNKISKTSEKAIKSSFTEKKINNKNKKIFKNEESEKEDLDSLIDNIKTKQFYNKKDKKDKKDKTILCETSDKNIANFSEISPSKNKNKEANLVKFPLQMLKTNEKNQHYKNNSLTASEKKKKDLGTKNSAEIFEEKVDLELTEALSYQVLPNTSRDFNGKFFSAKFLLHANPKQKALFSLMQILKKPQIKEFFLWCRSGKEGLRGESWIRKYNNKKTAIMFFLAEYQDKINEGFRLVDHFEHENIQNIINNTKGSTDSIKSKNKKAYFFDAEVKKILELPFDEKLLLKQIKEIGYDAIKLPFDRLTPERLQAGFIKLRTLEQVLKKDKTKDLFELSSEFYNIIPHNFGSQ